MEDMVIVNQEMYKDGMVESNSLISRHQSKIEANTNIILLVDV